MDDIIRRWAAVAFAVSVLAATAGVGVAQVGTPDSSATADTLVEPQSLGPFDESPKAEEESDPPSNGPEDGENEEDGEDEEERDEADESEGSDDSSTGRETSKSNAAEKAEDEAEKSTEKGERTKEKAESKAEKAKEKGEDEAETGKEKGEKTKEKAGDKAESGEKRSGKAKKKAEGKDEGGEKRAEKARNRGASAARVERRASGKAANSGVGFHVRNASANGTVSLRVGPPGNASNGTRANGNATDEASSPAASAEVAVDELGVRVNRGGDFTVNVTAGREAFETTPRFEREDRTEAIGHIKVEHSVPDENITHANFTFRLSRERLAEAAVGPENVALYRYHDGTWNELETEVVRETPDGVVFRAESPGLSEFAAGAKRPKFELEGAAVDVSKVVRGDSVYVNVNVSNVGAADGSFTADLILNDVVVDSKEVTVAAGGSRRIVFERTFDYPGTYDVRVNGVFAGTVVVEERSKNGTASGTPPPSTSRQSDGGDLDRFGVRTLVDAVGGLARSATESLRRFGR